MLTPSSICVEQGDAQLAIRLLACFEGILRSGVLDDAWLSSLRVGEPAPLRDAAVGKEIEATVAITASVIERLRVAEERSVEGDDGSA